MDSVDCVVVGAGVVGLAIARGLALTGREVVVVEQDSIFGSGVSSRNSEVIHAGIYYDAGSLKASCCVRGKDLLYDYCAQRGIPFNRSGKLLVATTPRDVPLLASIEARARSNGVADLVTLNSAQVCEMEPELSCHAALLSPSSGIVDSHALMTSLLADAEAAGAMLAVATRFSGAVAHDGGWIMRTAGDSEYELECGWIINSAGLFAQSVARATTGYPATLIPQQWLAKGHYFSLTGRSPFSRLVYPLPSDGGLGVHFTVDLGGQAKFGPDVEWLPIDTPEDALDYTVTEDRAQAFYDEIRSYWPALPDGSLQPAYAGIRPKLAGPGAHAMDFRIDGPQFHGLRGLIHLFGIESPGLTASMAIAERVASIVCAPSIRS